MADFELGVANSLNKLILCAHIAGTVAAIIKSELDAQSETVSYRILG
jgi:hypothetical protein